MNALLQILLSGGLSALIACGSTPGSSRNDDEVTPSVTAPNEPQAPPHPTSGRNRIEIEHGGERFLMEISDDDRERILGLSGRTTLGRNEGMLFVYPRPKVLGYWMKDCLIDLEIVYLRRDGRIASMHRMRKEPPQGAGESSDRYEQRLPRYPSGQVVQFALEFAPGTIDRLGLERGMTIDLPRERLVKQAR